MTEVLLYILLLAVASVLTWRGSTRLETASGRLARAYRLPRLVQGTLLVAVASSFPEVSTTVVSTLVHGQFELGMAVVVGSAIFNVLVIPGLAGLVGGSLAAGDRLVYRDALFYLTAVAVLLLTFSFALIYHPVDDGELVGRLTRSFALVPLGLYAVYLFIQEEDVRDGAEDPRAEDGDARDGAEEPRGEDGDARDGAEEPRGEDKGARDGAEEFRGEGRGAGDGEGGGRWEGRGDAGLDGEDPPARDAAPAGEGLLGAWLSLGLGLVLVLAGVEGLLRTAIWLGETLGTPSFLWGATVIAGVTSAPDAIISLRQARMGESEVSLGNALGSNIFDLLVAIPAGVMVGGAVSVDYGVAAPLVGALTLGTIVLFAFLRTDFRLEKWEGWALLVLYVVFLAWLGLETAGVSRWVA